MSFSRLLLIAANSKKCIRGKGNGKVCISPKLSKSDRDPYEGEVILCFQLDDQTDQGKRVPHGLGIPKDSKRCDGLVFYSQDDKPDRVICLVEMKSTEIIGAAFVCNGDFMCKASFSLISVEGRSECILLSFK